MSDAATLTRPSRLPVLATEVHPKCSRCGGLCCTYLALQIDGPRTYEDFDDIRWYVSHQGVQVFKDGRRWYLQVETRCSHLGPAGLCGIYERRPKICRDHGVDGCEFENDEPFDFALHFTAAEQVEAYMRQRFPGGPPARRRRRRRALPASLRRPGAMLRLPQMPRMPR